MYSRIRSPFALELYHASKNGDTQKVSELIKRGDVPLDVRFNEYDDEDPDYGVSALYIATKNNHCAVVELLLDAGVDPNLEYLPRKFTALHIAAREDHIDVAKVLIRHGANVNLANANACTPLDYTVNPLLIRLLQEAGAKQEGVTRNQFKLEKSYNLLVDEFRKNNIFTFNYLNPGNCNGLGKEYNFHEYQGRSEEFDFFISFINNLNPETRKELVQQYINPERKGKILKDDESNTYSLNKLLAFMTGIEKTQKTQSKTFYKSIYANWDAENVIACPIGELATNLETCQVMDLETGEYKFITTGDHLIALHLTKEGVLCYDSNHGKGAQLCRNTKELAQALAPSMSAMAVLYIHNVSYGNKNDEFDVLLEKYKDILETQTHLQALLIRYRQGSICRRNTAFILHHHIVNLPRHTLVPEFGYLEKELNNYLAERPLRSSIPTSLELINRKVCSYEMTLLHLACKEGNLELIQRLLAAGADINATTKDGCTPLLYAALLGHVEVVQFLLAAGADINATDKDGSTSLLYAASSGHIEVVQSLLAAGANINATTKDGCTPLLSAASSGHVEVVQSLLAAGANINATTKDGCTPLLYAASLGYVEIAKSLLAAGANINVIAKDGSTPLLYAASWGHVEIAKSLLAAGANINVTAKDGCTPLRYAEYFHHQDIVLLIQQKESVNKIVERSNIVNNDSITVKIRKLFAAYANPPFLSMHWQHHREVARTLTKKLKENPTWDGHQCKSYIDQFIADMQQNNTINAMGIFIGLIHEAYRLINLDRVTHTAYGKTSLIVFPLEEVGVSFKLCKI